MLAYASFGVVVEVVVGRGGDAVALDGFAFAVIIVIPVAAILDVARAVVVAVTFVAATTAVVDGGVSSL